MKWCVLTILMFTWPSSSLAVDDWRQPKTETTESPNGHYRFTSVPGDVMSKPKSAVASGARGRLEKKGSDGEWSTVWERELSNDVAPVTTIVSDSGKYIVTFDNWYSMGYGSNAVVIYGEDGQTTRAMGLRDFISQSHYMALPETITSIWWGGDHSFSSDGETLILKVVPANGPMPDDESARFEQVRVRLSDGEVLPR